MNLEAIKINISIRNKIDENLHLIKLFKDNDFNSAIFNISKGKIKTPQELIKYRILNFIKNTKFIENKIEEDNKNFIEYLKYEERKHIRNKIFEDLTKENKNNNSINIDENFINKINLYSEEVYNLFNPFNELNINLKFYDGDLKDLSFLSVNSTKIENKEVNESFSILINKNIRNRVNYKIFNIEYERNLITLFTVLHECAHCSFTQILNTEENFKEKHSDLSSLIYIIKMNDLDLENSKKLCNFILKYRSKTFTLKLKNYNSNKIRSHFTEDSLLIFKSFLTNDNLSYIKKIENKDICVFTEILLESCNKFDLFSNFEIEKRKILLESILEDPLYFKQLKKDYDFNHAYEMAKISNFSIQELKSNYPATNEFIKMFNKKIIQKCLIDDETFKDIFINYKLKTDFNNFINSVNLEIENVKNIKEKFESYISEKSSINFSIDNKTTYNQLKKLTL
jgi:hypothetical protein